VDSRQGSDPGLERFHWYRRSRLWVVPAAGMVAATAFASVTLAFDAFVLPDAAPFPIFYGDADTARSMLSLIATSIANLTALVLTIVAVVLQLATQSLSPRAVRTFLQDPKSHITLGLFVMTFTYSLVVLQQLGRIRDPEQDVLTSSSVTVAFALAVASIGMFILYVDHIVHQARVTSVLERVADRTLVAIDQQYPRELGAGPDSGAAVEAPEGEPDRVIRATRAGYVLEIDVAALLDLLGDGEVVVALVPAVGDFIPTGGRLLEVHGEVAVPDGDLVSTVEIDAERSINQDVLFGFRLLVDIAERALSPGVNDPTTATQALDRLHDLLRQLGTRTFPTGWHGDEDGEPRLYVRQPSWEVFVALAFEEIRHHGRSSIQVARRARAAIEDLLAEVPPERRGALRRQLRLLDAVTEEGFGTELERAAASFPDAQGIGSGAGFDPADADRRGRGEDDEAQVRR
jgi:uncharacterized membrane protein